MNLSGLLKLIIVLLNSLSLDSTQLYVQNIPIQILINQQSTPAPAPNLRHPFITLYENEFYQGNYYHHYLKKECTNLPATYSNWASSINLNDQCVYLCSAKDCVGNCHRLHNGQVDRLQSIRLNDKVKSIKFCYTFAQRG